METAGELPLPPTLVHPVNNHQYMLTLRFTTPQTSTAPSISKEVLLLADFWGIPKWSAVLQCYKVMFFVILSFNEDLSNVRAHFIRT